MADERFAEQERQEELRSKHRRNTVSFIRQIVILMTGILIIVYSLVDGQPAALMAGTALVGGTPLDAARPPREGT
jgi:hypothetical protein